MTGIHDARGEQTQNLESVADDATADDGVEQTDVMPSSAPRGPGRAAHGHSAGTGYASHTRPRTLHEAMSAAGVRVSGEVRTPDTGLRKKARPEHAAPLWRQLLAVPFATGGRTVVTLFAIAVVCAVVLVKRQVESLPEVSLDDNSGFSQMLSSGETQLSEQAREREIENARRSLEKIAEALELYAAEYGRFPDEVAPNLSELKKFGNMRPLLAQFEGGLLDRYERTFANDLSSETATIEARPKGTRKVFTEVIVHRFE